MKLTASTLVDDLREKARTSLKLEIRRGFILILKVLDRKVNLRLYFLLPLYFDSYVSKCFRVSSVNLITAYPQRPHKEVDEKTCDSGGTEAAERVELVDAGASILTRPAQTFIHFDLTVISLQRRGREKRQRADTSIL